MLDRPGLAAYIPRNGAPPIGPFFISNQGLAKVQDELAPEVARAADGNGLLETLLPIAACRRRGRARRRPERRRRRRARNRGRTNQNTPQRPTPTPPAASRASRGQLTPPALLLRRLVHAVPALARRLLAERGDPLEVELAQPG